MKRMIPIFVALFATVAFAQSITPEYKSWDRDRLEREYVAKLEECSRLRIELAAAKKQATANTTKPVEKPADHATSPPKPDVMGADDLAKAIGENMQDASKLLSGKSVSLEIEIAMIFQLPSGKIEFRTAAQRFDIGDGKSLFVTFAGTGDAPITRGKVRIDGTIQEIGGAVRDAGNVKVIVKYATMNAAKPVEKSQQQKREGKTTADKPMTFEELVRAIDENQETSQERLAGKRVLVDVRVRSTTEVDGGGVSFLCSPIRFDFGGKSLFVTFAGKSETPMQHTKMEIEGIISSIKISGGFTARIEMESVSVTKEQP